jgi:glycine betaine catabolism B
MDDFNEMLAKNPNLKVIITITKPSQNWKGLTGRIDRDMIEKYVPDYDERVFYSCGPRSMVDTMVAILGKMGVPEGQLRYEYFSGYLGVSGGKSAQ